MRFAAPRFGSVLLAIAAVAACGTAPAPPREEPKPPAPEAATRVHATADGNEIPYVVTGEGAVTVVLVHCWMCDRSFWEAQVPELATRYRVVTIDLPGHGGASARRSTWSVAEYGADVAGLLEALDLSDVVLVGHSMGGPVSLRAAGLAQGRVLGVVAVDSLHDAEFEFSGDQVEGFLRAFEADYSGTCRQFVDQMFPEEGVEEIEEHVVEIGCGAERGPIGIALLRNFAEIEMERWFAEAGVPIRAINAAGPNPTRVDTNRKYADFAAVLMEGVGHYLHMTRPREFNALLLDEISKIVDAEPAEPRR